MTPNKAQAIYEQALAKHRAGDLETADQLYQRILRARPSHAGALQHSGLIALQAGDAAKGLELIERAARLAPRDAALALNLAAARNRAGRYDDALEAYARAADLDPARPETCAEAGHLLLELGRAEEALELFGRALAKRPEEAAFLNDQGNALAALRRWEGAYESYDAAVARNPDLPIVRSNRGNAALRLGRLEAAMADQQAATRADPGNPRLRMNFAAAFSALGRYEDALAEVEAGLGCAPEDAELQFNRGLVRLRLGQFEEGWEDLEARKRRRPAIATAYSDHPEWDGAADLEGKTLLLHWEQGFGDTIQFSRYAKLAADRRARVILQVQAPLKALMAGLDSRIEVIGESDTPPPFDLQAPLMSLPRAFGTRLETIPAEPSYIAPDPALVDAWRARLGSKGGSQRFGLVWRGAAGHENDRNRSLPPAVLDELLGFDTNWISLQKDETGEEAKILAAAGATSTAAGLQTFSDTAAALACLDGLVAVDTSVAHLAGALGVPAWILLPFEPDWRWLTEREDSPCYPSLRLARQDAPGDWASAIARLRVGLKTP